jgi:hypothetical protein
MPRPTIIAVGGFSSEVGKTTLMCDLLAAFPGWEAIKTTRGHYRSCGKEPDACCVSDLLSSEPLVRSGYEDTYAPGKDTGRYWEAGAANVHWMIVTEEQVEQGIRAALGRVTGPGVFVEGNSFTRFVEVDFMLMVARSSGGKIKSSARLALPTASAVYLSSPDCNHGVAREEFALWRERLVGGESIKDLPVYTRSDLRQLLAVLRQVHAGVHGRVGVL